MQSFESLINEAALAHNNDAWVLQRTAAERDRAEARYHYCLGGCVALLLGLLYFAFRTPLPAEAPACAPNVMQLSPTEIRAQGAEVMEL